MNSKNIPIILLSITTVLFLILTLYFHNENIRAEHNKRLLSAQMATMSVKEFAFDLNKTMTGKKATDVLSVAQNGDEKYLSELMNGRSILIYRFRYVQAGGCRPCYEAQMQLIREVFSNSPQSVAILATYGSRRDFLISTRNNVSEIPMFHIPTGTFDWQFDALGAPYFFVLHPCMRISNIYVPDAREPELSRRYLESIKRLLQ